MALTPEQINAARSAAGYKPLATPGAVAPTKSFAERWAPTPEEPVSTDTGIPQLDILKNTAQSAIGGVKQVGTGASQFASGMMEGGLGGMNTASRGALNVGAGAVNTVLSPLSGVVETGLNAVNKATGGAAGNAVNAGFDKVKSELMSHPAIARFAQDNPNLPEIIQNLVTIGGTALGLEKAPEIKAALTKGADATSEAISGATGIPGKIKGKITGAVSDVMTPKELEAVLTTPESEVYKLRPKERQAYWKAQSEKIKTPLESESEAIKQAHEESVKTIKAKADAAEARVHADLQAKTEASLKKTQELKSEVDKVSNAEASKLKSKAIQVYRDNSAQFQKIFEEDFTPEKKAMEIPHSKIAAKLDAEFMDDPALSPKDRLKLDVSGDKTMTAGELYQKIRDLKSKVSSSGLRGASTYTAGDVAINRATGALTELLSENGVDLSRANSFWKQWKPLQREITSKVQPFNEYKTGTMANVLRKTASEVGDAKNAKFISSFEDQLGEKIGGETRAALQKLSDVQKQAIADKIAAEEAKAATITEKESALASQSENTGKAQSALENKKTQANKDLYDRQFSSEQEAAIKNRNKKILWKILGGLGVAGVGAEIGKNF